MTAAPIWIYTLSLHDALPIFGRETGLVELDSELFHAARRHGDHRRDTVTDRQTLVNRGVFAWTDLCFERAWMLRGQRERLRRDRRDVTADCERRRRGRRGRVEHVNRVRALHDAEIVDERAARGHRLGPNAGAAGPDVLRAQPRDETLERAHERALGQRAVHLVRAGPPVLPGHRAEAREAQRGQ